MATKADYCEACARLRKKDPNMVANGFTDENCASISHDLGLVFDGDISAYDIHTEETDDPSVRNKDCDDLNMMNDCLIGGLADEAEIAGMCGWQDYMKEFVPNMWTMFKALICAICGIWDNIWEIWYNIHRLWCLVNHMMNGVELEIGEEETDGSYVVAGKGVSFLQAGGGDRKNDISFRYIGGGLAILTGTLAFHHEDFQDEDWCWNYDLESPSGNPVRTTMRRGNEIWRNTSGTTEHMVTYGDLIFELRINLAEYPQIDKIFPGTAAPTGYGAYQINLTRFTAGQYAAGQHGRCNSSTGEPTQEGFSNGHLVPDGWIYIQARMISINYMHANGGEYTPRGYMGIRFKQDEIIC